MDTIINVYAKHEIINDKQKQDYYEVKEDKKSAFDKDLDGVFDSMPEAGWKKALYGFLSGFAKILGWSSQYRHFEKLSYPEKVNNTRF